MRRPLLALLAALIAVLPALVASPTAEAASRGPCVPGTSAPLCHFWTGNVTFVADGDTIRVDIDGDGTAAERTVRFTGINAMELTRYSKYRDRRRGACHGLEATAVVEDLIRRSRGVVRLSAQNPRSVTGHRLRRSVAVRIGGAWQDVGRILMEQGHALWLPNPVEWAHNAEYHRLGAQAAAAGRNLFDPDYCGAGPTQESPLKLAVNWDADGDDAGNLNGEWVDIKNPGPSAVSLAGWWVRDSWLIYNARRVPGFEFPSYATIPAGGSVRLHVGCGENSPATPTRFFWCQRSAVFENASGDKRSTGDGGYLFDRDGDLRAHSTYPCMHACDDPLRGKVQVTAHPTGPEHVTIANASAETVDLDGYLLKLHLAGAADKFIFGFPLAGTQLAPGESLQVLMDGSPRDDHRLVRHLGRGRYVLADGGNVVSLRSPTDVVVGCSAWGRARC